MADPRSGEYLKGRLWFDRDEEMLTIGLTNAAIEEIGSVQKIEFPSQDDDFDKGEVVVTIDGSNTRLEVITPAAGMIKELNETLTEEPDRLEDDPTDEGWLVRLEIQDPSDLAEFVDD